MLLIKVSFLHKCHCYEWIAVATQKQSDTVAPPVASGEMSTESPADEEDACEQYQMMTDKHC